MTQNTDWTEEDLEYLRDNYLSKSYSEMASILNRTKVAIRVKCSRLGIRLPEKYNFDKRYFDNINTEEKAYWLGFIYADGYISGKYELAIQLAAIDSAHLMKLNDSISGNFIIKYFDKRLEITNKIYKMCSIRIYSKLIVSDLENVGIIKNKSSIIEFPKIKKNLVRHFIRGYFDGDGSLYLHKEKDHLRCKFTSGSENFLLSIKNVLDKLSIKTYLINSHGNSFDLGVTSKQSTKKFLEYIYEGSNIYLDRKYEFYNIHKDLLLYKYDGWNNK